MILVLILAFLFGGAATTLWLLRAWAVYLAKIYRLVMLAEKLVILSEECFPPGGHWPEDELMSLREETWLLYEQLIDQHHRGLERLLWFVREKE